MRMAVSSDGKEISRSKIIPTPPDFDQGIQAFKQIAYKLANGQNFKGVAGGIAGPLDSEKTMLISSPHISGWVQKPLKITLEKIFKCKVFLENDTALVGLGEAVRGAGVGYSIVAYLGIGTGIGGARIVKGKIDENALGFEPGHQIIVPDGNICNCKGKGHLEAYVGGLYIEKIYGQKAENITDPKIWDEITKYLAVGLANTIVHWSPHIIILGGSVMKSIPLSPLYKHLLQALTIFPNPPKVKQATLGQAAGFYGALTFLPSS